MKYCSCEWGYTSFSDKVIWRDWILLIAQRYSTQVNGLFGAGFAHQCDGKQLWFLLCWCRNLGHVMLKKMYIPYPLFEPAMVSILYHPRMGKNREATDLRFFLATIDFGWIIEPIISIWLTSRNSYSETNLGSKSYQLPQKHGWPSTNFQRAWKAICGSIQYGADPLCWLVFKPHYSTIINYVTTCISYICQSLVHYYYYIIYRN